MNGTSRKKLRNSQVLLVGITLFSVLTAGIFIILPVATSKSWPWKWADWTGFGEDTTREESIEKNAKGQIEKFTEITKHQSGKTLWDLLGLAGTLAIPVLLAILGYRFQRKDQERAEKQAKLEADIAAIDLREEALQAYLDRMTELLLNKQLKDLDKEDPVRDVARVRTLSILRRLGEDAERKGNVMQFIIDAGLVAGTDNAKLDLSSANLSHANLSRVYLSSAILRRANLSHANLSGANLNSAILRHADLSGANLSGAILNRTNLICTNLSSTDLRHANLSGANLGGANLSRANLTDAKNLLPDQVKVAKNWEQGHYSPELRQRLGLPSEPSEADGDKLGCVAKKGDVVDLWID